MIRDSAEDVKATIRQEFLGFWEINLEPAFNGVLEGFDDLRGRMGSAERGLREVRVEIKGLGRLTARHSQDIMDLRTRR